MLVNIRTINFSRIPWNFRALYGVFTDVPRRFILRGAKDTKKCYCEGMIDQQRNKFLMKNGWDNDIPNIQNDIYDIQNFINLLDSLEYIDSVYRCLLCSY